MPSRHRIVVNAPEIASLAAGRSIAYRIGDEEIEIVFERMTIKRMILAILDATVDELPAAPVDPPEAREFLPRGRRG